MFVKVSSIEQKQYFEIPFAVRSGPPFLGVPPWGAQKMTPNGSSEIFGPKIRILGEKLSKTCGGCFLAKCVMACGLSL